MLGLNSHKLQFEILPSSNSQILIFLDESQYFEKPDTPVLKIVPPGYSKYFQVNIEDSKINVLNSHSIGYTEVLESECLIDLPDGIWHFTYMICPYKYLWIDKYHLRINALNKQLCLIYSYIDIGNELDIDTSCIKKDLIDINILIESAQANTSLFLISKAAKDFSLAQTKVKKLLDKVKKRQDAVQCL